MDVPSILLGSWVYAIASSLGTLPQWGNVFSFLQICRWSRLAMGGANPTRMVGQCAFYVAVIAAQNDLSTLPKESCTQHIAGNVHVSFLFGQGEDRGGGQLDAAGVGSDSHRIGAPFTSLPSRTVSFSGYSLRKACRYCRWRCGDSGHHTANPAQGRCNSALPVIRCLAIGCVPRTAGQYPATCKGYAAQPRSRGCNRQ